jgi:hypothetical protein
MLCLLLCNSIDVQSQLPLTDMQCCSQTTTVRALTQNECKRVLAAGAQFISSVQSKLPVEHSDAATAVWLVAAAVCMYVLFFWLQSIAVGTPLRETIAKAAISATPELALDAVDAVLTPLRATAAATATSTSAPTGNAATAVTTASASSARSRSSSSSTQRLSRRLSDTAAAAHQQQQLLLPSPQASARSSYDAVHAELSRKIEHRCSRELDKADAALKAYVNTDATKRCEKFIWQFWVFSFALRKDEPGLRNAFAAEARARFAAAKQQCAAELRAKFWELLEAEWRTASDSWPDNSTAALRAFREAIDWHIADLSECGVKHKLQALYDDVAKRPSDVAREYSKAAKLRDEGVLGGLSSRHSSTQRLGA